MKLSCSILALSLMIGSSLFAETTVDSTFVEKAKAFEEYQRQKMIEISQKYKEAVVEVEIIWQVAVEHQGQNQSGEEKRSINGVYVRKDGLIILPLSAIDPALAILAQIPEQARDQIKISSNPQSAKIRDNAGVEIDAEILLKDTELDILYVRPKEPLKKTPLFIDLAKSSEAKLLAPYYSFSIMNQRYGRAVQHKGGTFSGLIEKPKKYYLLNNPNPGMPIFDIFTENVLGFCLSPKAIGGFCLVTSEEISENMEQVEE